MQFTLDDVLSAGCDLTVDDGFDDLDPSRWLPYHRPQWSSRAQAAARYDLVDDVARVVLPTDVRDDHEYAAQWTPGHVMFFVDRRRTAPHSTALDNHGAPR